MRTLTTLFLAGTLAAVTAPAYIHAAETGKGVKVTYPAFDDSKYIHGPKITASSLKGKVVFFEYWGINCPPCIASMPHLQELQDNVLSEILLVDNGRILCNLFCGMTQCFFK